MGQLVGTFKWDFPCGSWVAHVCWSPQYSQQEPCLFNALLYSYLSPYWSQPCPSCGTPFHYFRCCRGKIGFFSSSPHSCRSQEFTHCSSLPERSLASFSSKLCHLGCRGNVAKFLLPLPIHLNLVLLLLFCFSGVLEHLFCKLDFYKGSHLCLSA